MLLIPSPRALFMTMACLGLVRSMAQGGLVVEVTLPAQGDGALMVAVCPDAVAFATDKGCVQRKVEAVRPVTTVRFSDLPAGRYAAKAFLDLNGNDALDKGAQGLPGEPIGFSNDVLGRPSAVLFEKAAVTVPPEGTTIRFRLRGKPPVRPAP
ncbi:MAG TPA: DUF2141 domain-containing protein [Flavobacteriales bacterium]|nr:DUF2141 domain-containing protein [Flavobacteriales bacterium]HMR26069.1 DUF2141 domain-containing protein [Flavobacteriales bacterium]